MTIPAFLSIDVEPEGFQLDRCDPPTWAGYAAVVEYAERLRADLTARTGTAPRFGWYFRTDPQIAEIHGRPDHALAAFPDRTAQLQAAGDYFGVHAHAIRWAADRGLWVHEFGNSDWQAYATRFALEAYGQWAGAPARLFRAGAGFLTNRVVEAAEQAGVEIDLSLEPVTGWAVNASAVPSGVDSSPIVGAYTDGGNAPRLPYRPARHDFRSTGAGRAGGSSWSRWRRTLSFPGGRCGGGRPAACCVAPPRRRWKCSTRPPTGPARTRRPYLSLGIRTDAAASVVAGRVRRIFDALPRHPLAQRLRFEDPLTTCRAARGYPRP